jgi:tetratricopeptide (TPR) repeat protein
MKRGFLIALVFAGCLAASPWLRAQAAGGNGSGAGQGQTPAGDQQKPVPQSGANPFPEDTHSVPVLPSKGSAAVPDSAYDGADSGRVSLPDEDNDPARSPDSASTAAGKGQDQESSSSLAGMDKLLQPPDDTSDKHRRPTAKEPTHQETAAEDINVGGYYLERKDWKAAQSRFESAMILDPENPEVFWGLAESQRHLGDFAGARASYQKVVDYDPDSKHGKDARKILKDPEIANAKNAAPAAPTK